MDYKVTTRYVTATPRRARKGNNAEASATSSGGGGASISSGGSAPSADAHTHPNLDTLNRLDTTPADGYLYLDSTDTDTGETVRTKVKAGFADEAASADNATNADNAAHATEADHAAEADHADTADDLTQWDTADQRYLSRQHDDTAEGSVTFRKATNFEASAQSPDFASNGFAGSGWAAQTAADGKTYVEADNLRIRGTLTAFELVIEKIRAICGALGISQACGRVKSVDGDATNYYLVLEGDDTHGYGGFQADDFIRCQRWTSDGARGYWVRVSFIGSTNGGHDNVLAINRSEFDAAIVEPHAGEVNAYDHVVQDVPAPVAQLVTDDLTAIITADDGTSMLLADNSNAPIAGQWYSPKQATSWYNTATLPTPHVEAPFTFTPTARGNLLSTYSLVSPPRALSVVSLVALVATYPQVALAFTPRMGKSSPSHPTDVPLTTASTLTARSRSDKGLSNTTAKVTLQSGAMSRSNGGHRAKRPTNGPLVIMARARLIMIGAVRSLLTWRKVSTFGNAQPIPMALKLRN